MQPAAPISLLLVLGLVLAACGENDESREEAYNYGFEEGISQVCQEIRAWNAEVYNTLR